jgi:hypothetical protein
MATELLQAGEKARASFWDRVCSTGLDVLVMLTLPLWLFIAAAVDAKAAQQKEEVGWLE